MHCAVKGNSSEGGGRRCSRKGHASVGYHYREVLGSLTYTNTIYTSPIAIYAIIIYATSTNATTITILYDEQ